MANTSLRDIGKQLFLFIQAQLSEKQGINLDQKKKVRNPKWGGGQKKAHAQAQMGCTKYTMQNRCLRHGSLPRKLQLDTLFDPSH